MEEINGSFEYHSLEENDLLRYMTDKNKIFSALEELSHIQTELSQNPRADLCYLSNQTSRIFNGLGVDVPTTLISQESVDQDRQLAVEDVLTTIGNGTQRLLNFVARIDSFVFNKLMWGGKRLKSMVSMISGEVSTSFSNAQGLPNSNHGEFMPSRDMGKILATRNGKAISFQSTKEILENHIEALEGFFKNREILAILHDSDLDTYKTQIERAVKKTANSGDQVKKNAEKTRDNLAGLLEKMYQSFKKFSGKPLADGKTLYFEFDHNVANNWAFHQDTFQIKVIPNAGYMPASEAKLLSKSEALKLCELNTKLLRLYKDADDWVSHINKMRQTAYDLSAISVLIGTVGMAVAPFIAIVGMLVVWVMKMINLVQEIVAAFSYTSSSLSYYAIRESCNYIDKSLANS